MTNNKKRPVALAGAHRAGTIKTVSADFDGPEPKPEPLAFQAAFIASRYHLSPSIARLICHLAQIGER
jgi:hypothetical protein